MPRPVPLRPALALVCFLLSGFAGLVYEVCWIRRAALIFGSTTFALSSVLAVFFGGLALGSWWFGRLAPRLDRPLRWYAGLELGLAALAALTPLLFLLAEAAYGPLYRALPGQSAWLFAARFAIVAAVLLPPTFLMGGTLPLFCRQFIGGEARLAGTVGLLYGLNTLGAALGAAAAGFALLPRLGTQASLLLAAALNVTAGLVAWRLGLRAPLPAAAAAPRRRAEAPAPAAEAGEHRLRRRRAAVGAVYFATGLVALASQVLWTRFLSLVVRNTVHTYTITLTVVLGGIVLGSLLAGGLIDRARARAAWFGALQAAAALATLAVMLLPVGFWRGLGEGPAPYLILMLPPAALSGALFPLANRLAAVDPALAAAGAGRLAALNTAGGIAGALAFGFAFLPRWGLDASLRLATGLGVATAGAAWLLLARPDSGPRRLAPLAATAVAAACWLAAPRLLPTRLPADHLAPRAHLVDFREGQASHLAAVRGRGGLNLEIDRLWQGRDGKTHQIMAAHVPMLLHPQPRRVLVVGIGTGNTAARFLMYGIEALDCVDIEPAIFPFVRKNFDAAWMDDARVVLIADDGRTWLTHSAARYDVISLEVGQVFRPGVEAFYTVDFYRRAAARLAPGGVISQFVPLPFFSPEQMRAVVRTFLEVFPEAMLWYNTSELLLLGRTGGRLEMPAARLALLASDERLRDDLAYSHWGGYERRLARPEVLWGGFLCGPDELAALAAGAPVYRDDRPVLSYATARVRPTERREVEHVALLRRHLAPPAALLPAGAPPALAAAAAGAAEIRDRNLRDLLAASHLRAVEGLQGSVAPAVLLARLEEALRLSPENPIAQRMMGEAQAMAGRAAEAVAHYEEALRLRPDDALARRGLAGVLIQTGRPAAAVPLLQEVLRVSPVDAAAHNALGAALAQLGRLPEAIAQFETAARLDPDDPDARRNLARARAQLAGP